MYLAGTDVSSVLAVLNADEEIAFLVADGPKRWKAIINLPTPPGDGRIGMWHIPSGPRPSWPVMNNTMKRSTIPFLGGMSGGLAPIPQLHISAQVIQVLFG